MLDQKNSSTGCEFYFEQDKVRLHMKLDLPEGLRLNNSPDDAAGGRPFLPEVMAEGDGALLPCPLVIVQHGFTGHMEEDHIIAVSKALNETGFATLRTELYGHGKSDGNFEDHTLYKWLTEMLDIIDYVRGFEFVRDLFLCGHSQGGLCVMLAGAMKRDVVRGLIPLSPAVMIPDDARKGVMLGHSFDPDRIPDVLTLEDGLKLGGNHARVSQTIYVEPAIDAFSKEVLIIHGMEDECVPFACAREAAQRYRNATLIAIPGDDHCYNHHLDQVTDALKKYMQQFVPEKRTD